MKQILSEKNLAGILFIVVMVVFSFAHEDSKKRNNHYNASFPAISTTKTTASVLIDYKAAKLAARLSSIK